MKTALALAALLAAPVLHAEVEYQDGWAALSSTHTERKIMATALPPLCEPILTIILEFDMTPGHRAWNDIGYKIDNNKSKIVLAMTATKDYGYIFTFSDERMAGEMLHGTYMHLSMPVPNGQVTDTFDLEGYRPIMRAIQMKCESES